MLISLIAATALAPTPTERLRTGLANLIRPPVSMDLTLAKGTVKVLWERPDATSERFRIGVEGDLYEYRGLPRAFLEIDWTAREYSEGAKAPTDFGPYGEIADELTSGYPFIVHPPNLAILLTGAKVTATGKDRLTVKRGVERLDLLFDAKGAVQKFTQTIVTPTQTITRDWVVTAVRRKAATVSVEPPKGMSPATLSTGPWTLDSSIPIPDFAVQTNAGVTRLSKVLGTGYSLVELVAPGESPVPSLAGVINKYKLKHLVIGPGQALRDVNGAWERTFAQGGYPVVMLMDSQRLIHIAFQGRMAEMVPELTEYLNQR
ncbi:MAG: hypothetical protein JNJ45_10760 [Chthonomonas sp.]|nr:hypothetical protein [Chthonomonas sp.]